MKPQRHEKESASSLCNLDIIDYNLAHLPFQSLSALRKRNYACQLIQLSIILQLICRIKVGVVCKALRKISKNLHNTTNNINIYSQLSRWRYLQIGPFRNGKSPSFVRLLKVGIKKNTNIEVFHPVFNTIEFTSRLS